MANITVSASGVTANETRAADYALAQINADRAAQGQPPFANMLRYLEWHIANVLLKQWSESQSQTESSTTKLIERWNASNAAQRTAALAQLAEAPA